MNDLILRKKKMKYLLLFLIVFGCIFSTALGHQEKSQDSPKYNFSTDWFSQKIPLWEKHLSRFKDSPNINYLEIGAFGRYSFAINKN